MSCAMKSTCYCTKMKQTKSIKTLNLLFNSYYAIFWPKSESVLSRNLTRFPSFTVGKFKKGLKKGPKRASKRPIFLVISKPTFSLYWTKMSNLFFNVHFWGSKGPSKSIILPLIDRPKSQNRKRRKKGPQKSTFFRVFNDFFLFSKTSKFTISVIINVFSKTQKHKKSQKSLKKV